MMPFLIGGAGQMIRAPDIFPSEACDISIANSVTITSLTSISASDLTEKFVIPSVWIDRIGSGVTLDLIMEYKNNDGTSRAIALDFKIQETSILSGNTPAISTAAQTRAMLIKVRLRRVGATTGLLIAEHQIGGGTSTGSGTPVGGFTAVTSGRAHNIAAPMPAVGTTVTVAVTAALAAQSAYLTLAVQRRRLYVW